MLESVWQYLWLSIVMDKSWHDVSRKLVLPHMPPPTWGIQSIVGREMLNDKVDKDFLFYLFYLSPWSHLDEILMRIPTVCLPVVNKMIYYLKQFGLKVNSLPGLEKKSEIFSLNCKNYCRVFSLITVVSGRSLRYHPSVSTTLSL